MRLDIPRYSGKIRPGAVSLKKPARAVGLGRRSRSKGAASVYLTQMSPTPWKGVPSLSWPVRVAKPSPGVQAVGSSTK